MKPNSYSRIYQLFHVYPYGKSLVLHFNDPKVMQEYVDQARAAHPEHHQEFYIALQPNNIYHDINLVEAILDISENSVTLFNVHEARVFLTNAQSAEARVRLAPGSLASENIVKYWRDADFIEVASLYGRAYFIPLKYPNVLFYMFLGEDLNDNFQITKNMAEEITYFYPHFNYCLEAMSFQPLKDQGLEIDSVDIRKFSLAMYTSLHRYYSSRNAEILSRIRRDAQDYAQMTNNFTMIEYASYEAMNGTYFTWVESNWPGVLSPQENVETGPEEPSGEGPQVVLLPGTAQNIATLTNTTA